MSPDELRNRTKKFALSVIALEEALPKRRATEVILKQLLRAATSVGANYRAACKARSRADFVSKITIVEEEADEYQYWLELLAESQHAKQERVAPLIQEVRELTAIFTSSGRTAKTNR